MTVTSKPVEVLWGCVLIMALLAVSGCTSAPKPPPAAAPASGMTTPASTAPLEPAVPVYAGPWEDPSNPLYQRTIYFDYDKAEVRPEYLPLLRTHARYLGTHASQRVTLEGHTDERGSREYNLALGDQRAEAVRRLMIADGVQPNQLSTLSYGEERPANTGRTEQAWRQNRRVVIQY
ncbi:peptidoglycan-associated lipoprotein [Thiocapsa imhoffii]|uniref:Peptidoglycan-associated lipoprotein n=1 Tax=Thiocapsa imhoffii TaxID=382777 RepID=A0A9X0WHJ7_9GAMM|nr:peptidoglycan-associated lipoprotein Pal [Thiocapsa imhoffii]MBK1644439.1 peptidoglycan-associated lipoprotein [Thiocapsa imhoffii]